MSVLLLAGVTQFDLTSSGNLSLGISLGGTQSAGLLSSGLLSETISLAGVSSFSLNLNSSLLTLKISLETPGVVLISGVSSSSLSISHSLQGLVQASLGVPLSQISQSITLIGATSSSLSLSPVVLINGNELSGYPVSLNLTVPTASLSQSIQLGAGSLIVLLDVHSVLLSQSMILTGATSAILVVDPSLLESNLSLIGSSYSSLSSLGGVVVNELLAGAVTASLSVPSALLERGITLAGTVIVLLLENSPIDLGLRDTLPYQDMSSNIDPNYSLATVLVSA